MQSFTVTVTNSGLFDTTFTETENISWMNVTFNADNTGTSDSLGLDIEPLTWAIVNSDLLVLDGQDTMMIAKLNTTNLDLTQSEVDNSMAPAVIAYDMSIKLKK